MHPVELQREWERVKKEAKTLGIRDLDLYTMCEDATAHIEDGDEKDRARIRHAWVVILNARERVLVPKHDSRRGS